jgi:hypothetical protein
MIRLACALALALSLGGCWFTLAAPVAGGVITVVKDILDLDVSWHQIPGAPLREEKPK